MSMTTWAEKEIEIACARERANSSEEGEWDYGVACYESALKAYKSLMEDGHSGTSIGITKSILNRLIAGEPLTPIEDTDDIWSESFRSKGKADIKTYQCKRMSSLFKDVYPDGTVKYSDVGRVTCHNVDSPDVTYTNGFIREIIDEMLPITMPYMPSPSNHIRVVCDEFLTDPKNGDFDTIGILEIRFNNGCSVSIHRYFKEGEEDWVEIDRDEYLSRRDVAEQLEKEQAHESSNP